MIFMRVGCYFCDAVNIHPDDECGVSRMVQGSLY
jgi:hypothetical protein